MAKASRDKGARGEREVCALFNKHGFDVKRVPNSGGLFIPGDVAGLDGFHVEVKRQERLDIPAWIRQAHHDAIRFAETGVVPIPLVVFRRNEGAGDPLGRWHAILPLGDVAWLIAEARRPLRKELLT